MMTPRLHLARLVSCALSFAVVVGVVSGGCISSSSPSPGALAFDAATLDTGEGIDTGAALDGTVPVADSAPNVDGGACPTGWVPGPGGVCVVSLLGSWAPSTDANSNGAETVASLGAVTATSVSVAQSHTGQDYAACGCNAQHLNIALGRSFSCATSTLEFDYATTVTVGSLNTPTVDIRFCNGPCPAVDGGAGGPYFYSGPQYVGSPAAPLASNCAYEWRNDAGTSANFFPASAKIQTGQKNVIALGSYAAPSSSDACTGTFDTIDVHLQVYNCAAAQTGTSTLSNLRVY